MDRVADDRKQRTQNKCCAPCLPRAEERISSVWRPANLTDREARKGARRACKVLFPLTKQGGMKHSRKSSRVVAM